MLVNIQFSFYMHGKRTFFIRKVKINKNYKTPLWMNSELQQKQIRKLKKGLNSSLKVLRLQEICTPHHIILNIPSTFSHFTIWILHFYSSKLWTGTKTNNLVAGFDEERDITYKDKLIMNKILQAIRLNKIHVFKQWQCFHTKNC